MNAFALQVMRPAGIAMDKLSAQDAVAPGSPYWEFLATVVSSGIDFDTDMEGVAPAVMARMQAIAIEELGWGDAGLAVSLGAGSFPKMMSARAGNTELVELCQ